MLDKEQDRTCLIDIADRLMCDLAEEEALTGEIDHPLLITIIQLYDLANEIKDSPDEKTNEWYDR